MKHHIDLLLLTILCVVQPIHGQVRLTEHNQIGWYTTLGQLTLSSRVSLFPEFQWRRDKWITQPQQELYRIGVQVKQNEFVSWRFGYAYIYTHAYGTYPINVFSKAFPEHRIFGSCILQDKIGSRTSWLNRFMYEGRWLGQYKNAESDHPDTYTWVNRMRFLIRLQTDISNKWYIAAYNEIFIGFGKNVNQNVFDQNRFSLLLGRQLSKAIRVELGYFNQVLQLGRKVNDLPVFQFNQGLILHTYWAFDLRHSTP